MHHKQNLGLSRHTERLVCFPLFMPPQLHSGGRCLRSLMLFGFAYTRKHTHTPRPVPISSSADAAAAARRSGLPRELFIKPWLMKGEADS